MAQDGPGQGRCICAKLVAPTSAVHHLQLHLHLLAEPLHLHLHLLAEPLHLHLLAGPLHLHLLAEADPLHLQILAEAEPLHLHRLAEAVPLHLRLLAESELLHLQILAGAGLATHIVVTRMPTWPGTASCRSVGGSRWVRGRRLQEARRLLQAASPSLLLGPQLRGLLGPQLRGLQLRGLLPGGLLEAKLGGATDRAPRFGGRRGAASSARRWRIGGDGMGE